MTKIPKFKTNCITSFVFGAAFAAAWTPCVGPILGSTFTLAATAPPTDDQRLYNLSTHDDYGAHYIVIDIIGKGFQAYTFTVG